MGGLHVLEKKIQNRSKIDVGVSVRRLKGSYPFISSTKTIEKYPIYEPFAQVKIVKIPKYGDGYHYIVEENPLTPRENEAYKKIVGILSKEMDSPTNYDVSFEEYVRKQAEKTAAKYRSSLGKFTERSWKKIFYYIIRELAGYGPLHVLFLDERIEDISQNGLNDPIYVWHTKYESIPTNIAFTDEQTANDFLVKLAHRGSKHISTAQPILDAMLPEKHRLAATFMKEVSTKGSTFCIRKFRAEPLSIVDLIKRGTLNERIAAYFWLLFEQKMSVMVLGGTGAGKTSMLNALLSLMSQNDKIVTVEEIPELSPPLDNWTQLHTRQSFQFSQGSSANISLFDLVKTSLRYRPDYIIIGEIRGEEAYVLFQALATGHGGLCTIHADSIDNVVKRLTSPPMNVSKVYIPLMNISLLVQRVELPKKREGISFGRRIRNVWEIEDFEQYRGVASWDPKNDKFNTNFENSFH
ncbi:type II/IV secretion system ATPase subunit, partial [Candidatus Bathyarchaeota archaeon]|nr:type II/IV secretion system ATPase subunit [Candidatus Bathyarchaeota archaeon]